MRGLGGAATAAAAAAVTRRPTHLPSSYAAAFSSFSGADGGAGRGRGRGLPPPAPPRAPGSPVPDDNADLFSAPIPGGRGRGEPVHPSSPVLPSFSSFTGTGRGRGSPLPSPPPTGEDGPKKPIFTKRFESAPLSDPKPPLPDASSSSSPSALPPSLPSSGAGRGVPRQQQQPAAKPSEENRHLRRRAPQPSASPSGSVRQPKLSGVDAIRRALELLGGGVPSERSDGSGGRGRRRKDFRRRRNVDEDERLSLFLGDRADGERLEKRLGEEKMKILDQAFDEAAQNALPHPIEDSYLDALHTNNMVEYEPEYMVNFDNPDIDEKPPMPLEEVLDKVKPFLIAYEGIQSQEEWEEAVNDVMERAPYMKELIDMYSGPDVVTAKQQEQELQRVASTLPESIPSSVKRFTDKAVLSLKSNPGWGFDKKCQFMDKLVWEVSQQYK